jgi:hypothetical protein
MPLWGLIHIWYTIEDLIEFIDAHSNFLKHVFFIGFYD